MAASHHQSTNAQDTTSCGRDSRNSDSEVYIPCTMTFIRTWLVKSAWGTETQVLLVYFLDSIFHTNFVSMECALCLGVKDHRSTVSISV